MAVDNETTEYNNRLPRPLLKNAKYKRGKLIRFIGNYAENLKEDNNNYYPFKVSSHEVKEIETYELKKENIAPSPEQQAKSKRKKKLVNFLYFAINVVVIAIVLIVQLSGEQNPFDSLSAILDVNWWFILAAAGTVLLCLICDQVRYAFLIHNATGTWRLRLSFKLGVVGKYYDVITPLSTGGQPFQVFYLNKYGIKPGNGISITVARYIFYQIIFFIFASIFLFGNLSANSSSTLGSVASGLATTLSWIGYVISAVVIIVAVLISLNKRFGSGLIVGCLKLLSKIKIGKFRIIKDYNKTFKSVMKTVNSWQKTMRQYSKSFPIIIINLLFSALYFLSVYSMPYFIYCAFAGWHPEMWIQIITISLMVDLSSAFNPIPMGAGTADLSFTAFFAVIFLQAGFGVGVQVWALIIFRILFYYIHILNGFLLLLYDYAIGNKRLEKNKEYWMLPFRERMMEKKRRRLAQKNLK